MNRPNFGWSYPPGAENDPRAPWNAPDIDEDAHRKVCEDCQGNTPYVNDDGETEDCGNCGGAGTTPVDCDGHDCRYCPPCRLRCCDYEERD